MKPAETSFGRRAASYWFVDGVPEIVSGTALAMLGAVTLAASAPGFAPIERGVLILFMGALLAILFGFDRVIDEHIKARLTWRRTGYVRPPRLMEEGRTDAPVTLGLCVHSMPDENVTGWLSRTVVALLLGDFAYRTIGDLPWALPLALSAVAVAIYFANRESERPYGWKHVLCLPAAGLALMPLRMSAHAEQSIVVIVGGLWLSLQGVHAMIAYFRTNPKSSNMQGVRA